MALRWIKPSGMRKHIATSYVYRGSDKKLRFEILKLGTIGGGKRPPQLLILADATSGAHVGTSGPYRNVEEAAAEAERMIEAGEVTL